MTAPCECRCEPTAAQLQASLRMACYLGDRRRYMAHSPHRFERKGRWFARSRCKVCDSRRMWHDWSNPGWMRDDNTENT